MHAQISIANELMIHEIGFRYNHKYKGRLPAYLTYGQVFGLLYGVMNVDIEKFQGFSRVIIDHHKINHLQYNIQTTEDSKLLTFVLKKLIMLKRFISVRNNKINKFAIPLWKHQNK